MTLFGDDDKRTNCVRDFFNGFFKGNCGSEISSLNFRWRNAREERSMVESLIRTTGYLYRASAELREDESI